MTAKPQGEVFELIMHILKPYQVNVMDCETNVPIDFPIVSKILFRFQWITQKIMEVMEPSCRNPQMISRFNP